MCVTFVTCECACVALVAIAGCRYTYTVCTKSTMRPSQGATTTFAKLYRARPVLGCCQAIVILGGACACPACWLTRSGSQGRLK